LGNHIIDKTVLVVNASSLELGLVLTSQKKSVRLRFVPHMLVYLRVVDFLENVLEATVVFLQDGVLGRHELHT